MWTNGECVYSWVTFVPLSDHFDLVLKSLILAPL